MEIDRKKITLGCLMLLLVGLFDFALSGQPQSNGVNEASFLNPPERAKPRTWFHAMSGNMSKAGLTKDLESMSEVGIGGLLLFNVTQGIPNGPIKYNSSEHHEMIKHAAEEAERLGLSFGVHNCDGWSASGGPWVTPEESMKMVVWNETLVKGGEGKVVQFQQATTRAGFYKDIAIIAYPSLEGDIDDQENTPTISSSDKDFDTELIYDGRIEDFSQLSQDGEEKPWIQFSYPRTKTIQSILLHFRDRRGEGLLQTSNDGTEFKDVLEINKVRTGKSEWVLHGQFPPISSRYFRIMFNQKVDIKEARLSANYLIENPIGRTLIARTEDRNLQPIGEANQNQVIPLRDIRVLKSEVKNNQALVSLPEGRWTLLRFGYTSTAAFNNPASDEGRGLEVDKLSRPPMKKHYDAFVKRVNDQARSVAPNALQYAEIDSYEMGGQNWTEAIDSTFKARNGYDLIPFLPLISGRFVENSEVSEQVLYDFRKLICDLMTENYFAYFTELCHQDGIESYIEPYGFGPLNDLDIGAYTDIPMGEFWMNRPINRVKSAVSGGRIYGKNIISAESFTSRLEINWQGHPAMAKNSGDLAWTEGINEFMFHRFAHQANTHVTPGMTMNKWGFHFDRTQTWWYNAGKDWFSYIARGSYLLQHGVPVSDILVFVGDASPNSTFSREDFNPVLPTSLHYDCINADALVNRISVENGSMLLPEGNSYKALFLKNSEKMELETLQKVKTLAGLGVPIFGDIPKKMPGYNHSQAEIFAFEEVAGELAPIIRPLTDWASLLTDIGTIPDFQIQGMDLAYEHRKSLNTDIYFFFNPDSIAQVFHATFRINDRIPEIWNPMDGSVEKFGSFRNHGAKTSLSLTLEAGESTFVVFREETGSQVHAVEHIDNLKLRIDQGGRLSAILNENGAYAVPLSNNTAWKIRVAEAQESFVVDQPWTLVLDNETQISLEDLVDWSQHENEALKYFSGTASYTSNFELATEHIKEDLRVFLDLGSVEIVAEVSLNGEHIAIDWTPPFEIEITDQVQAGKNDLEVKVTNLWSNMLIGEERFPANDGGYKLGPHRATQLTMPTWYTNNDPLPAGKRSTFTTAPFYTKDDPLISSGLIGPVTVKFKKEVNY